jgi:hypothetical protein
MTIQAFGKVTGLPLVGLGIYLMLLGVTGQHVFSLLFLGGAVTVNDAVPGLFMLAAGLILLRVTGGAPLRDQMLATRHWRRIRWISIGLFVFGLAAGLALAATDPLLQLPRSMYYVLSAATGLIAVTGVILWPNGQDRPAQS